MMPDSRFYSDLIIAYLSCLALVTATQELLSGTKAGEYGFQQSVSGVSDKIPKRIAIVGKLEYL